MELSTTGHFVTRAIGYAINYGSEETLSAIGLIHSVAVLKYMSSKNHYLKTTILHYVNIKLSSHPSSFII